MHHVVNWLQAAAKGNLEDRDQLFRTVLTRQQVIEHPAFVTTLSLACTTGHGYHRG